MNEADAYPRSQAAVPTHRREATDLSSPQRVVLEVWGAGAHPLAGFK